MQPGIKDREVQKMADLAEGLKSKYARRGPDPWKKSPFAWIKKQSSRRVGSIGEQLVAGWCAAKGLDVVGSGDSEADRVIAGHRVEIKFSTLWEKGIYKFQQIRKQNYEFAICLGVSPCDAHCWVIPKGVLLKSKDLKPQHRGKRGRDTYWFEVNVLNPPTWLKKHGGQLAQALSIMRKHFGRRGAS